MKLFEQMGNHLEFLGYSVEHKVSKDGKASFIAKHSQNPNLFFWEMDTGITIVRSSFNIGSKASPQEMDTAINELSATMNILNPYWDSDDGKCTLRFDTFYTGEYSKEIFAKFISLMNSDVENMYRLPNVLKTFGGS